jgi:hypothetical protein
MLKYIFMMDDDYVVEVVGVSLYRLHFNLITIPLFMVL